MTLMTAPDEQEVQRTVDIALTNFSDSLVPTDEFISEGKRLIQQVFERLKQKSRFNVDRVFFGGSVGKHTDVISPDFDCTVFINDEEPLFQDVIDDFENILILDESLRIQDNSIKTTRYSVQLTLASGFELDLLPAANLVQSFGSGPQMAEAQRQAVLTRIRSNPRSTYSYSSSLAESQLEFMRSMDSFTHQLVRLTKYWYKTLYFGEYISGGKTIVELIAVAAAEKEQGRQKSLLRAFMKVLDSISKIDNLKLAFVKRPDGKWESTTDFKFDCIRERKNYIIEPANPYNDMAESLGRTVVEKFKKFAAVTKQRFQNVWGDIKTFGGMVPYLPFDLLFEPLPRIVTSAVKAPIPTFMIGTETGCRLLNPDMKIRNESLFKKPEMRELLRALQVYLFSTVNSVVRSSPKDKITLPEVQKRVQKMVDENIYGVDERQWGNATERHDDFDVTFTYPFSTGPQTSSAVILSAKW